MRTAKLDRKTVMELALPDGKNEEYFWDSDLKGFALKLRLDAQGISHRHADARLGPTNAQPF